MQRRTSLPAVLIAGALSTGVTALGQQMREPAANVVVPQSRTFAVSPGAAVRVDGVDVRVRIVEQVATTTMDIALSNPHGRPLEAEVLVPVPDSAVLRSFAFEGSADGRQPSCRQGPIGNAASDR